MKKIIIPLLISLSLSACKGNENASSDTSDKKPVVENNITTVDTMIQDSVAPSDDTLTEEPNYNETIDFNKYEVAIDSNFIKAPLDWSSNPNARLFRTRIKYAYQSDKVDFAGYYIGVVFGCGAGCVSGFMIDVRDGKIYDAPLGEENSCFFNLEYALCNADSKLFISAICQNSEEDTSLYYKAYLWDETLKKFDPLENESDFLKPKN